MTTLLLMGAGKAFVMIPFLIQYLIEIIISIGLVLFVYSGALVFFRISHVELAKIIVAFIVITSMIIIFKKKTSPKLDEKEKIWFFDMKGDGSSLSKAKKFGPQYKNDIPKLLEFWRKNQAVAKPYSWLTKVGEIAENDYILSVNTYNPYSGEEEVNHRDSKEILREIESDEKKLGLALNSIKKLL